jgi:nucleoside-diphosphate-sugar epimerase
MAALLHIVNPPPELREKYESVNIGGTATVVEAAIKAGVKRVVLFSPIAVYGPSEGCGQVFNVTDGGFHTLNEIIESICFALGRKPPRLSLPVGPTRTLIGLIEKGSHAIGLKPPVTKAIIDKYTEDIAVDGSLIQKELGFAPQYDLKTGWEETIREM